MRRKHQTLVTAMKLQVFLTAFCCIAALAVAHSHHEHEEESTSEPQECDCGAFTKCIAEKKQERHEAKDSCFQTCKAELDPKISAAMEKCRENKNFEKFKCVLDKTCAARTTPKKEGAHKWRKGKKLAQIAAILPKPLADTIGAFQTCVQTCKEEKKAQKDKKECCGKIYPGCEISWADFPEAKDECEVTRAEDCCKCLIDELGITVDHVCSISHPNRVTREAIDFEDDSSEDIF